MSFLVQYEFLLMPLAAFLVVVGAIPLVCSIAVRAGFLDNPEGRKTHDVPVPPLGGVIIFSVFLLFAIFMGGVSPFVFGALALMLVVGVIDDARGIKAHIKFSLHFLAAFVLVIGGEATLHSLGNLLGFGDMQLGWFAIPFTIACVVYIQNAINMMDGVDGLAGGICLIVFVAFLMIAVAAGLDSDARHLSVLIATLAGFLVYNMRSPIRKRASIFLGDAGSMTLGLVIAWYAITFSQSSVASLYLPPVTVAWMIALPIVDSFALLIARLKDGCPPFAADNRHFHHFFKRAGFTGGQTAFILIVYSTLLGCIGYYGVKFGIPQPLLGWGWVALWIGHTIMTIHADRIIPRLAALRTKILT